LRDWCLIIKKRKKKKGRKEKEKNLMGWRRLAKSWGCAPLDCAVDGAVLGDGDGLIWVVRVVLLVAVFEILVVCVFGVGDLGDTSLAFPLFLPAILKRYFLFYSFVEWEEKKKKREKKKKNLKEKKFLFYFIFPLFFFLFFSITLSHSYLLSSGLDGQTRGGISS
jgi:hypothetical protein